MNNKNYNSGRLRTGRRSRNRFVSSLLYIDHRKSSIAIIASILALAIIVCIFFAAFYEESIPSFIPQATTSTKKPDGEPSQNVGKKYPYATVTSKTDFVASKGGNDLSDIYLYSEYAILIRLSDMTTIAHQDADAVIYPASMTKVMTVVTAIDIIENLDDRYLITREVLNRIPQGASTAWLSSHIGSYVSVRDLLYGISYMSGADSVICLIDYFGLTEEEFVILMNAKADEIGLENTNFGGAIGMDDEFNQTTCRDVAAIMAYAMENPLCQELFGGLAYKLDYVEMTYYNSTLSKTLTNMGTNPDKVLGDDYTLVAAKSGLEDEAGYCLVSYIKNDVTDEYFVLVTAKASRSSSYPSNKNTILDMKILFNEFLP